MENNPNPDTKKENINSQQKISNDPIFTEIQEILTDQEMIKKKLLSQKEDLYILELKFPAGLVLTKSDIEFILIISKEYPKVEPEVYCLTAFSHPHICDGRNLLNDIINKQWNYDNIPIEFIINKIPKFIVKYNEYKDKTKIYGKYLTNNLYPFDLLKNLPIFFYMIPDTNKIITIGDISLCLYDLDNIKKNNSYKNCLLTFFLNIKDIEEIQLKEKDNLIIIKYKYDKSTKKINIETDNYKNINDILKEKMKFYKKKIGKLPDIDIKYLENEIEEKEKELLNKNKEQNKIILYKEKCLRLMDLYQQAIEYYSAINDPKFEDINIKIHNLIEIIQLIPSSENKKEDNEKNKATKKDLNIDIKENKEIKQDNKENNNNKIETKIENKSKENEINKNNIEEKKEKEKIKEKKEEIKKNDIKEKMKEKEKEKENKKEDKKEDKKENKKENKKEDKKPKTQNNEDTSLRLKIDEGELNTLDVGEEEEEEEDDDNNNKK